MNRQIVRGDVVAVENYQGVKWRVLSVAGDLATLTKLHVSQRLIYRDVAVSRLTVKESALA